MKAKWLTSLQSKYLFLILLAVLILPITVPLMNVLVYLPATLIESPSNKYGGYEDFVGEWEKKVASLADASKEDIHQSLMQLHEKWPETGMFWVNGKGGLEEQIEVPADIPEQWSRAYTITYMKKHYDSNPLTVVTPLGTEGERGFMVVQIDRQFIGPPITKLENNYDLIWISLVVLVTIGFGVISWVFFRKVHHRLKRLKVAMDQRGVNGLPAHVERTHNDEIGEIEVSFNQMVRELEESRERERQEETIRREWIASLSHDLRTPLTTIRASLADISPGIRNESGREALRSINNKIDSMSDLIDNLLSLTLLTSKKYPYHEEKVEMNRFIRKTAAHWYSVFEQMDIEMELVLPDEEVQWGIDPKWMERIMDNLFQNVIRHASEGRYIRVALMENKLRISDRGQGMRKNHIADGMGIGLTIVDLMVKEMGFKWNIHSSEQGTVITLINND